MIQTFHRKYDQRKPDTAERDGLAYTKRFTVNEYRQQQSDGWCDVLEKTQCRQWQAQRRGSKRHEAGSP